MPFCNFLSDFHPVDVIIRFLVTVKYKKYFGLLQTHIAAIYSVIKNIMLLVLLCCHHRLLKKNFCKLSIKWDFLNSKSCSLQAVTGTVRANVV